jgi:hypothetical protein
MLRNGLFKGALMLMAGALFSWTIATMFEIRANDHAAARAKPGDVIAFSANALKRNSTQVTF